MTETLLRLTGVGYTYRGGAGIRDVDLDVRAGEVHALVGLNGAGKSTLMKLVLGMLRAQRGTVQVLGTDVGAAGRDVWAGVGAVVEHPLMYGELDSTTNLELAARMHGVARRDVPEAVSSVLAELDLVRYARIRAKRLSAGNAQRVGLAAALAHGPRLLVLDEPTAALDPAGIITLREALLRRATAGAGVLVSSHHLDEVARIADRISVIAEGRMIGSLDPGGVEIERAFFAKVHEAATA
jgi:ABC-2 type transport system ATP-binding protein